MQWCCNHVVLHYSESVLALFAVVPASYEWCRQTVVYLSSNQQSTLNRLRSPPYLLGIIFQQMTGCRQGHYYGNL